MNQRYSNPPAHGPQMNRFYGALQTCGYIYRNHWLSGKNICISNILEKKTRFKDSHHPTALINIHKVTVHCNFESNTLSESGSILRSAPSTWSLFKSGNPALLSLRMSSDFFSFSAGGLQKWLKLNGWPSPLKRRGLCRRSLLAQALGVGVVRRVELEDDWTFLLAAGGV